MLVILVQSFASRTWNKNHTIVRNTEFQLEIQLAEARETKRSAHRYTSNRREFVNGTAPRLFASQRAPGAKVANIAHYPAALVRWSWTNSNRLRRAKFVENSLSEHTTFVSLSRL